MGELVKYISKCRICASTKLSDVLSLSDQTLTGVFVKPTDPDPATVPLGLMICEDCRFVQLNNTVSKDEMYRAYYYRSGTNRTMTEHLGGVVADAKSRRDLKAGDIIIDIGCNDGTLLKQYDVDGLIRIGFDPSDAILNIKDPTIRTVNNYFNAKEAEPHLKDKKAKVITSISMFYDLDEPGKFVEDIKACLEPDGLWIVEMNYTGDMLESLGYDMISHEHVAYYTLRTFERLVNPLGLNVNDVTFNTINGGSIRIFVSAGKDETPAVQATRDAEDASKLDSVETYHEVARRIETFKTKLVKLLNDIRDRGEKCAIYGASTRGNTILQHCGIDRTLCYAAADRLPLKWGLETSGSRIPIRSEEEVRKDNPAYMLVLPYYFLEEFVEREADYLNGGGKFIVPLPELRILSKRDGELVEEVL